MSLMFGLDFGTTNSALSINFNGNIRIINVDKYNSAGKTLKSVIYFDPEENEFYVGQQAVNHYIENDALGRYIQSIKSFLPDSTFESTEIGKKDYKLKELIAIILRKIKERGEKYINHELDRVILGRPVIFSEIAKLDKLAEERLLSAANLAGFNEIYLQYEPIAAALAFESTLSIGDEKIVFVGDFGGGTSDFTIIKAKGGCQKEKNDRKDDILGLGGVYIGGDTFDSRLMWNKIAYYFGKEVRVKALMGDFDMPVSSMILGNLQKWHLIPQLRLPKTRQIIKDIKYRADKPEFIENLENLIDDNYGYMFFQLIEKAKCELSSFLSTNINFGEFFSKIQEDVSRDEFESFITLDIEKIKICIDEVVRQAGLSTKSIDVVFLTGGSSHIPIIKRIFSEKFGVEKINQTNAFTSVAYGLGVDGNNYI